MQIRFVLFYGLEILYSHNCTGCIVHFLNRIVLEAAYSLNDRTFSDHIGTVLLYAVVVSPSRLHTVVEIYSLVCSQC